LLEFALGELGLRPDLFWEMTWREYATACRGYYKRQDMKWLHTRELMALLYNPHVEKKDRMRPAEMVPLSFDPKIKGPKVRTFTAEEIYEINRRSGMLPEQIEAARKAKEEKAAP
jgi:hypothetical protein